MPGLDHIRLFYHTRLKKIPKRVAQFLVSPLRPYFNDRVHVMRSGPAKGMKRKGGLSFFPARNNKEEDFLEQLELQGKTVYDLGANVGVMSMFFSRAVGESGKVIAFEPCPPVLANLHENIRINNLTNIQVHACAAGDERMSTTMVVPMGQPGAGSINNEIIRQTERSEGYASYDVDVYPLDAYIQEKKIPAPDFVKMDIEGMEYQCLSGMTKTIKDHHPVFFIEMHGANVEEKLANARRVVSFLDERGYSLYHVESGILINPENPRTAMIGHLYCKWQNTGTIR